MTSFKYLGSLIRGAALALALSACNADSGTLGPEPRDAGPGPQLAKGGGKTTTSTSLGSLDSYNLDPTIQTIVEYLVSLLPCEPEAYVQAVTTVGPKGGTLVMGNHTLVIPRGALASEVTITGEVVTGWVNSVRLSPHGLTFATPATLRMSYANCSQGDRAKQIAYTDENLTVLEVKPSRDDKRSMVSSELDHFSRYAVAW